MVKPSGSAGAFTRTAKTSASSEGVKSAAELYGAARACHPAADMDGMTLERAVDVW